MIKLAYDKSTSSWMCFFGVHEAKQSMGTRVLSELLSTQHSDNVNVHGGLLNHM
jgi:hypothetical protein